MPLSYDKINSLFNSKGFIVLKKFIRHDICYFLEVISVKRGETFIVSISSKHKLAIPKDSYEVYKLKNIDIAREEEVRERYTESPDPLDLEKSYSEVEISQNFSLEDQPNNLEKKMLGSYDRKIDIKNIERREEKNGKEIFQQLKRLKFCIKNLPYKLAIIYLSYLCVVSDYDNVIDSYHISHFNSFSKRKLYITIDLDMMIQKLDPVNKTHSDADIILDDIQQISQGINKVLEKNSYEHTSKLNEILESKDKFYDYCVSIETKRKKYSDLISSFEKLLSRAITTQDKILKKRRVEDNGTGYYMDVGGIGEKLKTEKEYDHINKSKNEILEKLLSIRDKNCDLTLSVDKILFDNILMLNTILDNLSTLDKICES